MADSVKVALNPDDWTDVSNGAASGYISNEGKTNIIYREAALAPAANDVEGHTMSSRGTPDNYVRFSNITGTIWARSVVWDGAVEFTES